MSSTVLCVGNTNIEKIHSFIRLSIQHMLTKNRRCARCCAGSQRWNRLCQPSVAHSEAGKTDFQADSLHSSGWKSRLCLSCLLADGGCPVKGGRPCQLLTHCYESDDKAGALLLTGSPAPVHGGGEMRSPAWQCRDEKPPIFPLLAY